MADFKLDTPKRMGAGFTGVLLVAGVTFYLAKRRISEKRKGELDDYQNRITYPIQSSDLNTAKTEQK